MNLARVTTSAPLTRETALPASHVTIVKLELPQQSTRRYDVTLRLCRPLTSYESHAAQDAATQAAKALVVEEGRRQTLVTEANSRLGVCPHTHDSLGCGM
jgi:hypothetical protein